MSNIPILWIPYALNIIILVPVCIALFFGGGVAVVFNDRTIDSEPLSLLVSCVWLSVLVLSIAGLFMPRTFWPLLMFQVLYKALYLLIFVAPALARGQSIMVPWGVAVTFAAIVLLWPFFILQALKA